MGLVALVGLAAGCGSDAASGADAGATDVLADGGLRDVSPPQDATATDGQGVDPGAEDAGSADLVLVDSRDTETLDGPHDAASDCDAGAPPATHTVRINEVTSADTDSFELVNAGSEAVDLAGWRVYDSQELESKSYVFPVDTVLEPGAYLVFVGGRHHSFGLGSEDALILKDSSGATIDVAAWAKGFAKSSFCRFPDTVGGFIPCSEQTFGEPNRSTDTAELVEPAWTIGQPVTAPIWEADELDFDPDGRLWCVDAVLSKIQVWSLDGTLVGTAGSAGSGPGQFLKLESVRSNHGDEVYAVGRFNGTIEAFDRHDLGWSRTVASGLEDPVGIAVTSGGDVLVVLQQSREVLQLDSTGGLVRRLQYEDADGAVILVKPETLALHEASDRVFVTSEYAHRVEVFELSTGTWTGLHVGGLQTTSGPEPGRFKDAVEGIAVYPSGGVDTPDAGVLFAVDEVNGRVLLFDLGAGDALFDPAQSFAALGSFGGLGSEAGRFGDPDGVTVSVAHDRLAVADDGNDRVTVYVLSELLMAVTSPEPEVSP